MARLSIDKISARGFRGIRGFKQPVSFNKLSVIVGGNDCGKTSLLEALYLVSTKTDYLPFNLYLGNLFKHSYGFNIVDQPEYVFYNYDLSSKIVLTYKYLYNGRSVNEYSLFIDKNNIDQVFTDNYYIAPLLSEAEKDLLMSGAGGEIDVEKWFLNKKLIVTRDESIVLKKLVKTIMIQSNEFFNRELEVFIKSRFRVIEARGLHVKITRKYINPSLYGEVFTELTMYREDLSIRKEVVRDNEVIPVHIRLRDLGDGVYRAVLNLLYIEYMDPDIVLWDDYGTYMHPALNESVLKYIVRDIVETSRQYIITTYNIDTLYYLVETLEENTGFNKEWFKLIVLYKDRGDMLDYHEYNWIEFKKLLEGPHDPRKIPEELGI